MFKYFKSIKERDPAARHFFQILFLYPGVHALFFYRVAHFFFRIHLKFLAEWMMLTVRFFTHIEIHPGAVIGKRLFIDHGSGVVIGETSIIGDDCTMYQGATLGGTGHHRGKRHPTIGNRVMIGAGAKILGPITIGDDVKVGANTVVLQSIDSSRTVVGVKGKVVD